MEAFVPFTNEFLGSKDSILRRNLAERQAVLVERLAQAEEEEKAFYHEVGTTQWEEKLVVVLRNKEEMRRVHEAFKEIFEEAIRLGGTITGEHGIGLAKKEFLPKFAGKAQMRVMRELRKALDPKGILNPGKMFD